MDEVWNVVLRSSHICYKNDMPSIVSTLKLAP